MARHREATDRRRCCLGTGTGQARQVIYYRSLQGYPGRQLRHRRPSSVFLSLGVLCRKPFGQTHTALGLRAFEPVNDRLLRIEKFNQEITVALFYVMCLESVPCSVWRCIVEGGRQQLAARAAIRTVRFNNLPPLSGRILRDRSAIDWRCTASVGDAAADRDALGVKLSIRQLLIHGSCVAILVDRR
jgi:hypothetical protein